MDHHLRKKIVAMHDLHDLIKKKMDPGQRRANMLKKILDNIQGIKSQRKSYNEKLAKHFSKIKKRLMKEHKRLRNRLKRHGEGRDRGFDNVSKLLSELRKQHEAKPHQERAERLEKKMDKVLSALSDREKALSQDAENA